MGAAADSGGAVAVHCDRLTGAVVVLLTAALLRNGLFSSAAAAGAWLRLLRPVPAAAAAATARVLAHDGGGGMVLPDAYPSTDATANSDVSAVSGAGCSDGAAATTPTKFTGFHRRAASFCGRPSSPAKSLSPARDGRRRSDPCASAAAAGGERLVWRRTPSGSRARLCSAYGDGDGDGDGDERKPFAASSPELLPFLAAAAGGR
jgi:hypothetical protein